MPFEPRFMWVYIFLRLHKRLHRRLHKRLHKKAVLFLHALLYVLFL